MNAPDELRDGSRAAGWLNKLLSFVKMTRLVEGVGYRLIQTTRGTALEIQPGKGGTASEPATISQYRFKAMGDDTIECVEWDGLAEGATVNINKPFILRRTPFDNKTITYQTERTPPVLLVSYVYTSAVKRTARIAAETETQIVLPRFTLNDIIYATNCEQLGSGDEGLIDINADGRTWAAIF